MRITLTIGEEEREILRLSYSYYDRSFPSEHFYRSFLEEYFPYPGGFYSPSYFPYYRLKKYQPTALDKKLREEAVSVSRRGHRIGLPEESSEKEEYYRELTRLRYNHRLDRGIIPNIYDLEKMSPRPSEVPYYRPTGSLGGGLFNVVLDSAEDSDFYYRWLLQETMQEGEFCCYRDEDIVPYFRIRFMDCYCVSIRETTSPIEGVPMVLTMELSPGVIWNRGVEAAKTWRISDTPHPVIPSEEEEEREPLPAVTRVMWKNQEGEEINLTPEEEEKIVTLYIETENCSNGESIKVEIVDDENTILYDYTTNSGKNERIELKGFDLYQDLRDYAKEKETDPDDIFRMRYTLRAHAINNPSQKPEAIIESEPQCTVHFRRTKDWDGDYFFDWIRTGDTRDTTDKYDIPYHSTKVINDKTPLKGRKIKKETILMNYLSNYEKFEQDWRKKYPKYQNVSTYYVPCLGIRPDQTVTLRMLLQMEQPSGVLTFTVRGTDQLVIESETEFNTDTLYKEATSTSIVQYITPLKIKCNGEIKKTAYIDILAGNHLVGQLAVLPNPQYKLKAEIVNVLLKYKEKNGKEYKEKKFNEIKEYDDRIIYTKKLLQQVNIDLDIKVHTEELDFRKSEKDISIFGNYITNEDYIHTKIKLSGNKTGLDNEKEYDISEFLFERLKKLHSEKIDINKNQQWESKLLIYLFAHEGWYSGPISGIAFRDSLPQAVGLFNYSFEGLNKEMIQNTTGNNIAHEIIHIFYLDHIHDAPIHLVQGALDNIMDYIPGNPDYRKTLIKCQYEEIQKAIKKNNYPFIEKR